jgi:hypothetical protein
VTAAPASRPAGARPTSRPAGARPAPRRFSRGLLAALALVALAGCWTVPSGVPRYRASVSATYARALAAHTRTARVYRDFAQRVMVVATLQTPDFLEARFAEDGRIHAEAPAASEARLTAWQTDHAGPTAVVYLEAADSDWLDLGSLEHTWRVALTVGGESYDATHVESLDTGDPTLHHLFPFMNDFGAAFLVDFPAAAKGAFSQGATLVVAGAPAQVRLSYAAPR